MGLDIAHLRELLSKASCKLPLDVEDDNERCSIVDADGFGVLLGWPHANIRTSIAAGREDDVDSARLAAAAVNALPQLLEVATAAVAWRDSECSHLRFCEYGDHEHDCDVMQKERALYEVLAGLLDAVRKESR